MTRKVARLASLVVDFVDKRTGVIPVMPGYEGSDHDGFGAADGRTPLLNRGVYWLNVLEMLLKMSPLDIARATPSRRPPTSLAIRRPCAPILPPPPRAALHN
jgi:hypothetical protein